MLEPCPTPIELPLPPWLPPPPEPPAPPPPPPPPLPWAQARFGTLTETRKQRRESRIVFTIRFDGYNCKNLQKFSSKNSERNFGPEQRGGSRSRRRGESMLATIQPFRATCDNYRNSYAQPPGHAFAKAAPQVDTSGSRVWPSYGKPLTDEGERLYLLRLDLL
jgi:hypothetical protein